VGAAAGSVEEAPDGSAGGAADGVPDPTGRPLLLLEGVVRSSPEHPPLSSASRRTAGSTGTRGRSSIGECAVPDPSSPAGAWTRRGPPAPRGERASACCGACPACG
jgi:hypothetical protein